MPDASYLKKVGEWISQNTQTKKDEDNHSRNKKLYFVSTDHILKCSMPFSAVWNWRKQEFVLRMEILFLYTMIMKAWIELNFRFLNLINLSWNNKRKWFQKNSCCWFSLNIFEWHIITNYSCAKSWKFPKNFKF